MKRLIFTIASTMTLLCVRSQDCRFLEQTFLEVQRSDDIEYGVNATILYFPLYGQAIPEPLLFDLYEPINDTLSNRPLIIYFHSGNFLPYPQNQSPVGTKRDSSSIEFCTRLAKAGYVVASADYRLGWNPLATNPIDGTTGIINAAYRGVQDANTCIRYFKKSFAEDGNPYRIDTCRIVLFGDDTGGYLSVHAGALDRYSKILESVQFQYPINDSVSFPMISDIANGDVEGKQYGINTPPYPLFPFPPGDTLCYPNHIAYSSRFCAAVNIGGAVAEASWIEPGQPPIISVGTQYDLTTPYDCGIVWVGGNPIINVCGPMGITEQGFAVGNLSNAMITPEKYCSAFQESITSVSLARNEGLEGLLPVIGNSLIDFNPWILCDTAEQNCQTYIDNFQPDMASATLYIDTILAYVMPRLYNVLNLSNQGESCIVTSSNIIPDEEIEIHVFPNPSSGEVSFSTPSDYVIRNISVFDMKGVLVNTIKGVNSNFYSMRPGDLPPGIYLARLQFNQGIAARLIVVQ